MYSDEADICVSLGCMCKDKEWSSKVFFMLVNRMKRVNQEKLTFQNKTQSYIISAAGFQQSCIIIFGAHLCFISFRLRCFEVK